MTRSEILKRADEIINGQREQDYGSAERNFGLIGQLWTVYLDHLVTAEDVANMMTLFKIARIKTGRGTEDSYIDAVGYMACGGEIATEETVDGKPTDNLQKATAGMRPKYIKFLKTQIEEQTDDKHKPTGNKDPLPPYIVKMAEENERKRELLRAIFGNADDAETDSIADIVRELREISDNLYRVAHDLEDKTEDEE